MMSAKRYVLLTLMLVLCGWAVLSGPTGAATDPCTQSGQSNIDQCAWNTFSDYLENDTWTSWSSTADLLNQKTPGPSGSRYYPEACHDLSVANPGIRVISQVGKVADTVFEAGDIGNERQYTWTDDSKNSGERTKGIGLSGDPVVAANGTFVRYEIMMNPTAYNWIVSNKLYVADTLQTWSGDLIFPDASVVIKNAWMPLGGLDASHFYTEELLIYTAPSNLQSDDDECLKMTMALVGQHIATKTSAQPAWTWATLEQRYAAPDCTTGPKAEGKTAANSSCPSVAAKTSGLDGSGLSDYLLNPTKCSGSSGACAACNGKPSFNCSPNSAGVDTAYCVDAQPNAAQGTTQACRQQPVDYYRTQANEKQSKLSDDNYMLISTQWYSSNETGDINIAPTVRDNGNRGNIKPASENGQPILGNSSMETYEKSNCIGCHSSAVVKQTQSGDQISTDFMFWLTIEVPCGANGDDSSCEASAPLPAALKTTHGTTTTTQ